ncbi:hypothetical protein ACW7EJ_00390, partial [Acinetobacter soli]
KVNAQTDKYRGTAAFVSKEFIQLIEGTQTGKVSANALNVRADATIYVRVRRRIRPDIQGVCRDFSSLSSFDQLDKLF